MRLVITLVLAVVRRSAPRAAAEDEDYNPSAAERQKMRDAYQAYRREVLGHDPSAWDYEDPAHKAYDPSARERQAVRDSYAAYWKEFQADSDGESDPSAAERDPTLDDYFAYRREFEATDPSDWDYQDPAFKEPTPAERAQTVQDYIAYWHEDPTYADWEPTAEERADLMDEYFAYWKAFHSLDALPAVEAAVDGLRAREDALKAREAKVRRGEAELEAGRRNVDAQAAGLQAGEDALLRAAGWQQQVDADGNTYFWHEQTGRSQWERPAVATAGAELSGQLQETEAKLRAAEEELARLRAAAERTRSDGDELARQRRNFENWLNWEHSLLAGRSTGP